MPRQFGITGHQSEYVSRHADFRISGFTAMKDQNYSFFDRRGYELLDNFMWSKGRHN